MELTTRQRFLVALVVLVVFFVALQYLVRAAFAPVPGRIRGT